MTAYRVVDGTQVHHDGRTYTGGEIVEADEDTAADWLRAEWVQPAPDKPKPRKR